MTKQSEDIVRQWESIKEMRKQEQQAIAKIQKILNREIRGKSAVKKKNKKEAQ